MKTIKDNVGEIFLTVLKLQPEELEEAETLEDLGVSSTNAVQILGAINHKYNLKIPTSILFECRNINALVEYIQEHLAKSDGEPNALMDRETLRGKPIGYIIPIEGDVEESALHEEVEAVGVGLAPALGERSQQTHLKTHEQVISDDIAIIGLTLRCVQAETQDEFWDLVSQGKCGIEDVTEKSWLDFFQWMGAVGKRTGASPVPTAPVRFPPTDPVYRCGRIKNVEYFDPLFFKISPHEAEAMDVSQRILLEECYKALEDAGYPPPSLSKKNVATIIGSMGIPPGRQDFSHFSLLGSMTSILASRIAFFLNLKGPALAIDTACSSSLVAIDLACQQLRNHDVDLAIAGGITIYSHPGMLLSMRNAGMLSPTGVCRPFDHAADGIVVGDGIGIVILKRLQDAERDADPIYGVIQASGTNQDGQTKGLTVPSFQSQSQLQETIYRKHRIDPCDIQYVEAHGTGTKLGDPIEIHALTHAFNKFTSKKRFCAIGSLKANIGHAGAAAGVLGLIKVLVSLKQKQIPPSIHLSRENEHIDFANSPVYVNTALKPWPLNANGSRMAAISSFGFSGTNAHLVISEYVAKDQRAGASPYPSVQIKINEATPGVLILSAECQEGLYLYARKIRAFLQKHGEINLADLLYTFQVGRESKSYRLAFVVTSKEMLLEQLEQLVAGDDTTYLKRCVRKITKQENFIGDTEEGQEFIQKLVQNKRLEKLAELWLSGNPIPWEGLYPQGSVKRLAGLPTFPFAKEHYEISQIDLLHGFGSRPFSPQEETQTRLLIPSWVDVAIPRQSLEDPAPIRASSLVLLCDLPSILPSHLQAQMPPGGRCRSLSSSQSHRGLRFQDAVIQLIQELQHLQQSKPAGPVLVQVVVADSEQPYLLSALAAVLRVAQQEYPKLRGQLIEVEGLPEEGELLVTLRKNQRRSQESHIRYSCGKRWVRGWQEHHDVTPPAKIPWKEGGCYLITGGAGGLARLLVQEIARQVETASVILCGRSVLSREQCMQLEQETSSGIRIDYQQVDVSDGPAVHALIERVVQQSGHLDGIIHAAGLIHNARFFDKTPEEIQAVLSPKVMGVEHLDEVSRGLPLDFFILCSSLSAVLGSIGFIDYAAANAYLDAFAHARQALVLSGERQGETLSINWPYWEAGGMQTDVSTIQMMRDLVGEEPMGTETGIRTLYQALAWRQAQVVVLHGQVERIKQQLLCCSPDLPIGVGLAPPSPVESTTDPGQKGGQERSLVPMDRLRQILTHLVSNILKVRVEEIDSTIPLTEYGCDSITFTQLANRLNQTYQLNLTPPLFFELSTIELLAQHLQANYAHILAPHFALASPLAARVTQKDFTPPLVKTEEVSPVAPVVRRRPLLARSLIQGSEQQIPTATSPIAIIGMSGLFPQAPDVQSFWHNLLEGKDCIGEIPASRWDWQTSFGHPETSVNATNIKWAGVIEGVEMFDPLFFGISPREAEQMDPQQRLLMMYVWRAIEDAGYSAESLSGTDTAVFVGTASSGYAELLSRASVAIEGYSATGLAPSVGPNRVSYFLNLHGPSELIDTACSSSLVAIHRGVKVIESGECSMAIVGGVNTLISSGAQVSLSKAGMLSSDGHCKTFSAQADGYVRGEGVGVLVLKKLFDAEQAGDHIYGVIRGSAENHGGRASSLTAPNPRAQADLLITAYRKAGIDPRTVGYIEAHGTGTELGDPLEINGLKTAFSELAQTVGEGPIPQGSCGIGSVKSNIGHLELAAGVAGVIKVLLQLQHKKLVKSLHCEQINPYIELKGSPFYIVQETRDWEAQRDRMGNILPRRAGVSSFGFGGVNAHVVLEEYVPKLHVKPSGSEVSPGAIIVLSARNKEQLHEQVRQLLAWLQARTAPEEPLEQAQIQPLLDNLAYTLQVGRSSMEERLALQVSSLADLVEKLGRYLQDPQQAEGNWYRGQTKQYKEIVALLDNDEELIGRWLQQGKYEKLPAFWVKGLKVDWRYLYGEHLPRRISLPTYPFAQERYWIPATQVRTDERSVGTGFAPVRPWTAHTEQTAHNPLTRTQTGVSPVPTGSPAIPALSQPSMSQNPLHLSDRYAHLDVVKPDEILAFTTSYFVDVLSTVLKISPEKLDQEVGFDEYGLDSIIVHRLHAILEEIFGSIPSTTFFRYKRIRDLAHYFLKEHAETMYALFQQRSNHPSFQTQDVVVDVRTDTGASGRRVTQDTQVAAPQVATSPQDHGSIIHHIQGHISDRRVQIESIQTVLGQPTQEMDEMLVRLLWQQLQTAGWFTPSETSIAELKARVGLPTCYNRWLDETIVVLAQRKYLRYDALSERVTDPIPTDSESVWSEWERQKAVWLADPDLKARVLLVEATLHALPEILTGQTTATAILFPKSSFSLLEGIYQRNRMADFFNAILVDTVVAYLRETIKIEKSARLRILEIGAGTGGTSAMIFQKLLPYQEYIQEYCYTDLSQAFLWHAKQIYGPQNPYLTYKIFNVEVPLADQDVTPGGYDLVIAANVLHATRNIRQALRNAKALLKPHGFLLLNELTLKSIFLHLTFGLLEGWWLYEDTDLRLPGCPILELQTWQAVLQQEGFQHLLFPVQEASTLGQQIIVAEACVPHATGSVVQQPPAAQGPSGPPPPQITGCQEPIMVEASSVRTLEQDIAIIGISGQYPQSPNLDAFWSNLESGRDCIVEIPPERWDYRRYYKPQEGTGGKTGGMYCKWGGFLPDIAAFDPSFFHISPLEARLMDPQERLFLQTVSACFEDAGYSKHLLRDESAGDGRANVGVFVGVTYNNYQLYTLKEYEKDNVVPVNSQTYSIANRVSYIYNLRGPSLSVDTACSSSLVAIHLACESIKRGECTMAIAGGVNLSLHPSKYTSLCVSHFASSNGRCRSFGQDGDGIVPGEGVGAVLLKPLRDAMAEGDHISAVIKGTAINNDGKTFGYSVPNPVAQTEVIRKALKVAQVDPRTISYVEAHGTGTKLGDPIEITGLSDAYQEYTSAKQYCAIGSVKSNIGHLEAAAGISQITKVVLQMKHKKLVPSLLHTTKLNPYIDFEKTPFFVQQTLQEWIQPVLQANGEEVVYPRRAGISSFGAGGVNVHIVLEEYQVKEVNGIQSERDQEPVVIVLSAQKEQNLNEYARVLKDHIEKSPQCPGKMARLKDIAYTLQTGRDPMPYRLAFTAREPEEIIEKLEIFNKHREIDGKNGLYVGYGTAEKKLTAEETLDNLETIRSSPAMMEKMARLWASGREIDWTRVYQNERCLRVPLPTYPFSKERYWVGDVPSFESLTEAVGKRMETTFLAELCQALPGERLGMIEKYLQDILASLLAFSPPDVPELNLGFFDLGMESVLVEQFRVSLEESLQIDIADTAIFDYPNISALSEYLVKRIPFEELEKQNLPEASKQEKAELEQQKKEQEPIAIIGMGCRFPGGCHDPETFWRFLAQGGDGVIEVPRERFRIEDFYDPDPEAAGKIYLKEAGFLQENVGNFDARFFGISPREAVEMDPQQRLLLEVSWEALERAGIPANQLKGTQTGVFIGITGSEYTLLPRENFAVNPYMLTGSMSNIASGRISYILGVHGPSMSVDTACSSSLVVVHLACESLHRGESSLALAGGVNLLLAPIAFLSLCGLHALAKDGRCKTFDADGDGYGRGEGCGVVVLKRLSDALRDKDPILAVIKGTGVNQDGPGSGLTVPNGMAQKELILKTLEKANVSPHDIGYVEVHGTGTALGDPIEFQALTEVFGRDNKREKPLSIGSVKSNIGHLEAAAGIASLVKSVLCLQNKHIPPNLHLHTINPKIRLESIPAMVPQKMVPWETNGTQRMVGISSFGFSGTNAHAIVSEWHEARLSSTPSSYSRPWHLLALSAKDEKALSQLVAKYGKYFEQSSGERLEDICFTANAGRTHFPRRIAFLAENREQMKKSIAEYLRGNIGEGVIEGKGRDHTRPKLAFLIQGKIKPELAQSLFETQPMFQKTLRSCDELLQRLAHLSLLEKSGAGERIHDGNTVGLLGDVLAFASHLSLLKVWEAWGVRPNAVLGSQSGALVAACAAGIMEIETAFGFLLEHWGVTGKADGEKALHAPQIRIISGCTGKAVEKQEALSHRYWEAVLSEELNGKKGMESLRSLGYTHFLQIGSRDDAAERSDLLPISLVQDLPSVTEVDPWRTLTNTLAHLYCLGLDIDWSGFEQGYSRQKVLVPTYPFQRNYFWSETTMGRLVSQVKTESRSEERPEGSLLDGRIINSPLKTKQIEYCLNLDAVPDVKDVNGVLHVGYYLELLCRVVKKLYHTTVFHVQTIDFLMGVMIPASGTATLSLTLTTKESREVDFSFFSHQGNENWNKHAQGIILLDNAGSRPIVDADLRSEIISRCTDQYSGAEFYHHLQERGIFLGESIQWLEQVWASSGEALARLRLPHSLQTSQEYAMGIHPGVFDACAQLFLATLSGSTNNDMRYLVSRWEDFTCYKPFGDQPFWCHVVLQDGPRTSGPLAGRFHLFDQNGMVVAQIRSGVMKGMNRERVEAVSKYVEQSKREKDGKSESKVIDDLRRLSQDQWRGYLNDYLQQIFAHILRMEVNGLSIDEALMDVGMDSLAGVEAKHQLEEELGIFLPLELLIVGPSICELTESILPLLATKPSQIEHEIRDAPLPAYKMDIPSCIVHRKSNPQARVKLFCFPCGGIGASLYRGWQARLPDYIEVCPIQLPGKENRVKEKAFTDIGRATDVLKGVLLPELDRPYAFYGHSVGALLAYRLAYKLWSEMDNKPGHLFVGAYSAPTILPNPLLSLIREKFKEIGYDDIPDPESLSSIAPEQRDEILLVFFSILGVSVELLRLLLPTILAELQMVRNHKMVDNLIFDIPITAIHGGTDDKVTASEMHAWQELTQGPFAFHTLPGDHLFANEDQDQKQLLELISRDLEKYQ